MVLDQYKVQKRQGLSSWERERDPIGHLTCNMCGCSITSHGVYEGQVYRSVRCDRCGNTCLRKENWYDFDLARRNLYRNVNRSKNY